MIGRILFCSDGSAEALSAAKLTACLAKACCAKLTLLNVYDLTSAIAPYTSPYEPVLDAEYFVEVGEQMQTEVEKRTGRVFEQEDVPYVSLREMGHPVDEICSTAKIQHSDLIVLGSRGLNPWQELLLGSVSEGVLHHSKCSVLIAKGQRPAIRNILLATDGSTTAGKAARFAGELTCRLRADLTVLNVFEPNHVMANLAPGDVHPEDLATRVRNTIAQGTGPILDEIGVKYNLIQHTGKPAEAIVTTASNEDIDLIVMGSRGLGTFKSLLLGSVSTAVAHHTPCSLLVVR